MKKKKKKSLLIIRCLLTIFIMFTYIIQMHSWAFAKGSSSTEGNKIIYLTFDDGPSNNVTNKMLDILKEQNVKATFFVVGCKISGREDILKRMYQEGHSIGLHTYTHVYKQIYANEEAFMEEMNKTAIEIKNVVGIDSKIIRFPSGSKNHLTKSLLQKLHDKNYRIYDWNLCASDGIDYNTPRNKLYEESTKKCINPNKVFLLMHCDTNNKNTYEVLEKVIKYYKDLGYEFKTITPSTPEYYFRIKK